MKQRNAARRNQSLNPMGLNYKCLGRLEPVADKIETTIIVTVGAVVVLAIGSLCIAAAKLSDYLRGDRKEKGGAS